MPGPFLPNGILAAAATCASRSWRPAPVGSTITSKFAGTIPADTHQSFPDYGFKTTACDRRSSAPPTPPLCAELRRAANGNGETLGTRPLMSSTTIIANEQPAGVDHAPADGAKYLPDAQIFADLRVHRDHLPADQLRLDRAPGNAARLLSQFGIKTFTVTATDTNGGVTRRPCQYDVGGNVTPDVDAGADRDGQRRRVVTLQGSATDPDSGQILSYEWTQISGTPAVLDPSDADDPFEPDQRFTVPRTAGDLTFRLRVDDGYDTGEDTIVVHVCPNNGPTITNGVGRRRSTTSRPAPT